MTSRDLTLTFVVCLFIPLLGCAGLDVEPVTLPSSASVPVQASPRSTDRADAERPPDVRPAAHEAELDEGPAALPEVTPRRPLPQPPAAGLQPRTIEEALHPPVGAGIVATEHPTIGLDLTQALAMAGGQSPQIAFAAARYREAYAQLQSARVLWLPSIRAGASFNHHDGMLQASDGDVLAVNRSSLEAGMGARAVGAGSPAVPGVVAEFRAADAVFQPRAAAHAASARQSATQAAMNDTLLATALAYLDLLRAKQQERIAEATRDNAQNLADLTAAFARTGQGPQADADRAQTELVRRQNDVSRAREGAKVAAVRLAELLSIEPSLEIVPQESTVVPIDLVSPEAPASDLVATGLSNRPELCEAQSLVCEAVSRYRREQFAPLMPSVLLGISQSGFGGGQGSNVDDFRGRFDFDAAVVWELRNAGLGEYAKRAETRAQIDQVRAFQARLMDRVVREVLEAAAQIQARKTQIELAESGVQSATHSYERNLARIRQGEGLPIEVLQSLQALDEARREYLRTMADYNEAQFRLQRALGWPIQ